MFFKYNFVFVFALLVLGTTSLAYASISYRVMSSKEGWQADKKNNTNLEKPFCTAINVYEQDFPMYLSKDQNNTALTFYLANLTTSATDTHDIKLLFDNQTIISRKIEGLSKPIIKVALEPNRLEDLYNADKVTLSVGNLGYEFENDQISTAQSIVNTCLQTKLRTAEFDIKASVASDNIVKSEIKKDAPVQFQSSKAIMPPTWQESYAKEDDQNVDQPIETHIQPANYDAVSNKHIQPDEPQHKQFQQPLKSLEPAGESIEDSYESPANISAAMEMEQQLINNRDRVIQKPELQVSQNVVSEYQTPNSAPPLTVIRRSYDDINANRLSEDERDLFESMKTKMFLLEQEKQAAKSKLTDLRQKEIEVMKVDIGSKQKITEQAEKIRILQEKLQKYQYHQINDGHPAENPTQDKNSLDIDDVVDGLTADAAEK